MDGSRLKAVIFDCDGILVDSEPIHYESFQQVLRPLGLDYDYRQYVEHYIGFDDRDGFLEVFRSAGRPLDARSLTELIEAKQQAFRRVVADGVRPFPGVVELVRELVACGAPLAVASGSFRHEVELFLDVLHLQEAFPIIAAAEDVEHSKPDPATYLVALRRLQERFGWSDLDPRMCIAIEDTPAGIRSAHAAGLYVIGVTNSQPAGDLSQADHVVESLLQLNVAELVRLLAKAPA